MCLIFLSLKVSVDTVFVSRKFWLILFTIII